MIVQITITGQPDAVETALHQFNPERVLSISKPRKQGKTTEVSRYLKIKLTPMSPRPP